MPELPEVEHLRRCIDPHLVGRVVLRVEVRRRSVVAPNRASERDLLEGACIARTSRRGKQLAIEADDGRAIVVQLGMTGGLSIEDPHDAGRASSRHRHIVWTFAAAADRRDVRRLVFIDPRRFGGVTAIPSPDALRKRWENLGPDALAIDPAELRSRLAGTRRAIKAALLDQSVLAGVGNIYADESLFAARIHPERRSSGLSGKECRTLALAIRRILGAAAEAGGSTLRDYRDPFGQPGSAVQRHKVYGRAGRPCSRCKVTLEGTRQQGRATVHCPACQPVRQDLST